MPVSLEHEKDKKRPVQRLECLWYVRTLRSHYSFFFRVACWNLRSRTRVLFQLRRVNVRYITWPWLSLSLSLSLQRREVGGVVYLWNTPSFNFQGKCVEDGKSNTISSEGSVRKKNLKGKWKMSLKFPLALPWDTGIDYLQEKMNDVECGINDRIWPFRQWVVILPHRHYRFYRLVIIILHNILLYIVNLLPSHSPSFWRKGKATAVFMLLKERNPVKSSHLIDEFWAKGDDRT